MGKRQFILSGSQIIFVIFSIVSVLFPGVVSADFSDEFIDVFKTENANNVDGFTQAVNETATIQGAPTGDLKLVELPEGAQLREIKVYSRESSIEGLQLSWYHEGEMYQSPLIGRDVGEAKTVVFGPDDALLKMGVAWNENELKALLLVKVTNARSFKNIKEFGEKVESQIEEIKFGDPEAAEDHEEITIIPGQNLSTLAACVQYGRGSITGIGILTEGWIEASEPDWVCGEDVAAKDDLWGGSSFETLDEMPYYMKFAGPWIEEDKSVSLDLSGGPEVNGLDNIRAGTWTRPKMLKATFWDKGKQLRLRIDGGDELILERDGKRPKAGKISYFSGLFQAEIIDTDSSKPLLTVTVDERPNRIENGVYKRARQQGGNNPLILEKVHFPDRNRPVDDWTGLFGLTSVVYGFASSLDGYDGAMMSPRDPASGQKEARIFADPSGYDHFVSTEISKSVPDGFIVKSKYGLSHYEYSEKAISSESELQKSTSYNFGVSGAVKAVSLGANYSHQESSGMRKEKSSMRAYGFARILQHVLVIDRTQVKLHPDFEGKIMDLVMGKTSALTVINTYGTHYANAITYGGLAIASNEFSQEGYANWRGESTQISASGGAKGVSVSGGYGEEESEKQTNLVSFTKNDFMSIGGLGGTTIEGFTPGTNPVPVLYDLRPISELVHAFYLPDLPRDMYFPLERARNLLDDAIAARFAALPPADTQSYKPVIYKVKFKHLICTDAGDESDVEIELGGEWNVAFSDASSDLHLQPELALLDGDENTVRCNNQPFKFLNKEVTLWAQPDKTKKIIIMFSWNMTEYDTPPFDPNENFRNDPDTLLFVMDMPTTFEPDERKLELGGKDGQPTIELSYTIQRID